MRVFVWGLLLLLAAGCEKQRPLGPQGLPGQLLALRRYEELVNGQRAGVYEVRWTRVEHEGRLLVQDTTRHHRRTERRMGPVRDVFETDTVSVLLRTDAGELLRMETTVRQGSDEQRREDRELVEWTGDGYDVATWTGGNHESYTIEAESPTYVDPETFLGPKIRAGEAKPGAKWSYPSLATGELRKVVQLELEVIGPDEEGPGLKVAQRFRGDTTLWWFDDEGTVVRVRAGNSVTRRADQVGVDDLPPRPASWRVTLPSNVTLPRIFTTQRMVVDVTVETDETTRPPRIPPNPFTRVLEEKDARVRLELLAHDDPEATTTLPIDPAGFERFLKATRLMEADDPKVRAVARRIVGDEKDARKAAAKLADWVFRNIGWHSPPMAEPTARQILENPTGDCSEHNLMFVALCRAAGIPARRCSGWVCIGEDWGGHAWCEIWVGKWIGADATTNEIGTRARYIMLSRPDEPEVAPGSIMAERTEIEIVRAEYADGVVDLENSDEPDPALLSGIRTGDAPDGWEVAAQDRYTLVVGSSFRAFLFLQADQGYRAIDILLRTRLPGGRATRFGGRPAVKRAFRDRATWIIPLGREILCVNATSSDGTSIPEAELAKLLKPTLERE